MSGKPEHNRAQQQGGQGHCFQHLEKCCLRSSLTQWQCGQDVIKPEPPNIFAPVMPGVRFWLASPFQVLGSREKLQRKSLVEEQALSLHPAWRLKRGHDWS